MANDIWTVWATGATVYALIKNYDNEFWYPTGEVFETWGTGTRTSIDYAVPLTEVVAGLGDYSAEWPTGMSAGKYLTYIKLQAGDTPLITDLTIAGPAKKYWTGIYTAEEPETNAVNICNRALAKLGGADDTITIETLGDGTRTSDLCDLLYTPSRKEVQIRGLWQEIMYYADLGDESAFAGEKADWLYAFDLPDECLHVTKQTNEQLHRMEYPFEVKQNVLFTNILSNTAGTSAYIEYIKNETDGNKFSEEQAVCIVTKLAAELAPRIVKGDWGFRRREEFLREFEELILPTARGTSQSQGYHNEAELESHYGWLGGRQYEV